MNSINMSTERLRFLLQEFEENDRNLAIHPVKDVPGPGGGVYITSQTALTEKHLEWIESRSLSLESETYLDVQFVREGEGSVSSRSVDPEKQLPKELDLPTEKPKSELEKEERATVTSKRVVTHAKEVAGKAEKVYKSIGAMDFTAAELRKPDVNESLREFERSFRQFHGAVKKAVDEYLNGNPLVMDLILKFQLDKATVRHALAVAAFATEMAALLALRDEESDEHMESYFGGIRNEEVFGLLGEDLPEEMSAEIASEARRRLFGNELVEIFLGGFVHDCGLWTEPFFLQEGHEVKGAKLISETKEVESYAPALAKTALLHSDIVRLAKKYGVVKITERPDDADKMSFKSEFYDSLEDAHAAVELRHGNFDADILSAADLRKILPVSLAEYYISHTEDVYTKPHVEVVNELAAHIRGGQFQKYMVVLCNSRIDVVAPRRSLVKLDGHISVIVDRTGKSSRRAQRLDVDEYDAGSLHHGNDRNSPHLITLFQRRKDGSREKAEYVNPQEHSLWERAAGLESRMYIPAGRYKNNISYRVTGFMSEEVYEKVLGEYEQEFRRRTEL